MTSMTRDTEPGVLVYRDGATIQARLTGPLDAETILQFQGRLEAAVTPGCGLLALDLTAVDYLDSDGIRWLQRFQAELASRQVELQLTVRAGSRVERTLRLLRLERTFAIHTCPSESAGPAPVPSG